MHAQQVLHRDVKPANIMVTSVGEARLLDLGVARIEAPGLATGVGQPMRYGTPAYCSPEQWHGGHCGPSMAGAGRPRPRCCATRDSFDQVPTLGSPK